MREAAALGVARLADHVAALAAEGPRHHAVCDKPESAAHRVDRVRLARRPGVEADSPEEPFAVGRPGVRAVDAKGDPDAAAGCRLRSERGAPPTQAAPHPLLGRDVKRVEEQLVVPPYLVREEGDDGKADRWPPLAEMLELGEAACQRLRRFQRGDGG